MPPLVRDVVKIGICVINSGVKLSGIKFCLHHLLAIISPFLISVSSSIKSTPWVSACK